MEGRAALEMGKGRSQRSKVEGGWDPVGGAVEEIRGGLSLRNRWGVENHLSLWPLNG